MACSVLAMWSAPLHHLSTACLSGRMSVVCGYTSTSAVLPCCVAVLCCRAVLPCCIAVLCRCAVSPCCVVCGAVRQGCSVLCGCAVVKLCAVLLRATCFVSVCYMLFIEKFSSAGRVCHPCTSRLRACACDATMARECRRQDWCRIWAAPRWRLLPKP